MPIKTLLCYAFLSLGSFGAVQAAESSYRYDTVHSQILFSIDHNGYSRPFGRLHIAKGVLHLDPANLSQASTELDIDLASLDMGDAAWNTAVLKPDFLDSGKNRYAHFVSTGVESKDANHGVLHGNLTLRGVTRPIDINFTFNRAAKTIYGLHTVAGFSGNAMLNRADFGMTAFKGSIGQSVSVWLELEAIKDDDAGKASEAPAPTSSTDPNPKESP
ncbi:YceI family protein [Dyella sp. GSA-30]|uniref:YceI family protein n=1 Tax=Dyella sp. GSA-30 TaxID=2994496 RepID=UPI0024902953|nr:YceI family protein [Dyella sp. GSA-30]BDU20263.1 polyisoprenoid-binding protein [Dyella sp. GSA-30]